jgi:hypothetical protein
MSHYTNQRIITEQEWWNSLRSQIGQTTYSESYCVDLNEMDFLDPSKSPILQGAKNFAGGLSTGLKQGYDKGAKDVEELGKFLTPGILKTIEIVANVSQKFADKVGISPVTAAMIVGIAATAPAALPAYILALSLRRVATNLANKMYDTAWEKLTGKTVEELDKMWVDWKSKNPTAATPKVVADSFDSFNSFLRNKDINLYQKIYLENEYQEDARGVGEFLGKGLGYGAGAGVSIISNSISSIAKLFSSVMKMIANNPVATGKVLFGVIIGYYVGKLGAKATEKVTDMIQGKLSAAESDDIRKVAEKVGVPQKETDDILGDKLQNAANSLDPSKISNLIRNPDLIDAMKKTDFYDNTLHAQILKQAITEKSDKAKDVLWHLLFKMGNDQDRIADLKDVISTYNSSELMNRFNEYQLKHNSFVNGIFVKLKALSSAAGDSGLNPKDAEDARREAVSAGYTLRSFIFSSDEIKNSGGSVAKSALDVVAPAVKAAAKVVTDDPRDIFNYKGQEVSDFIDSLPTPKK